MTLTRQELQAALDTLQRLGFCIAHQPPAQRGVPKPMRTRHALQGARHKDVLKAFDKAHKQPAPAPLDTACSTSENGS